MIAAAIRQTYPVTIELTLDQAVAAKVKALRTQRGWTQCELAASSGVHQTSISRLEAGKRGITLAELELLGHAFGVGFKGLLP